MQQATPASTEVHHGASIGEPLRLLVIGDDPTQRELIERLLSRSSPPISVLRATSFDSGVARLLRGDVDCALVDARPGEGTGGIEFVRRARAHGVRIPLIVLAADADADLERDAAAAGANDHLVAGHFAASLLTRTVRNAVERSRIINLLEDSQQRLGAVVSSAPVIIYSLDRAGLITFIEGKGLAAFGSRPEDVLGRSVFELYQNDAAMTGVLESIFAGNEFQQIVEIRGISLECRAIPQLDAEGRVVSCVGVCMDVTARVAADSERVAADSERKRLMRLLEDERRRLEDLLQNLPAIVWEAHITPDAKELRNTYVSDYIEKLLGYTPEQWIADPNLWLQCIHPDDRQIVGIPDLVHGGGTESSLSFRMIRSDGRVIWVDARFTVMRDNNGSPSALRGIILDVTDQRSIEKRLAQVSQLNRSIVESVNADIAVIDQVGRIVLTNRGWIEYGDRYGFGEALDWSAGQNYLQILSYAAKNGRAGAGDILQGTKAVLSRETEVFGMEYQVHPIRGGDWYHVSITPLQGRLGAVVVRTNVTERHRAEEASRASQRQFESFMDNSPAIAFIKDSDGRYVYVNEAYARRVSRSKAEVVGATDHELWPKHTADMFVAHDREVLTAGTALTFEERTMDGDREIISHVVKFPIRDASGDLMLCGEAHDVTQRIQAVDSLRTSEERFRLVARATSDIVYDWDLDAGAIWWNENLEKLLGYAPAAGGYDYEWWKSQLHPEDLESTVTSLEAALHQSANHWSAEYRLRRHDGSYAAVYERGYVIYHDDGDPMRMIGAISDRTSFVEAEEALRRSEEEYRRIVETAQEGIWVTSETGTTTFVNATMARLLGHGASDLIGRRFEEFLAPEARETARSNQERRRRGISDKYDLRMIRSDGTAIWTHVSASPILDRNGLLVGSLAMVTDITERKRAEDELRAARADLEKRVAERTAELASAMRRLENAHLAQKRFIADASHDLRTPLTVVRAELDLLRHNPHVDETVRISLERALEESRRLDHLSTDLLTLAALDSTDPGEVSETLRVDELILGAVESLTPLARERGITWAITLDEAVEVRGNELAVERALWNVLDNAIKYSPDDGLVSIATTADERWVTLTFVDEGIGIPEHDIPKIFERFYRGDAARSTPGTGLGLSIVKTVVESHGGSLWVESEPGRGTRVTVTLPRP